MVLVRSAVASAPPLTWIITAPVLLLALRSAADVAVFSPVSRFFALVWGLLFFLRNFHLFLGYAFGVAFFALSVYSPLLSVLQ